ncbi:nucleoside hydrolase [Poronia punctata]|nr:nucleoside hydrolase [Poronia punctata]
MAPRRRVIIDTDPGGDDTLALLLALASSAEELEILLISVTYGNIPLEGCVRNVVGLFKVLDLEMKWREEKGLPLGFEALRAFKPLVALGPEHPLEDENLSFDYFHGIDGLHGVHEAHPHFSPEETWKALFKDDVPSGPAEEQSYHKYFTPSKLPAHKEILRILKEEPADTVSICAVGPLTNLALAASEDPETFLRVKEVCVMGGAVEIEGNVTPVAEFNTYADAVAAARVFALTSPVPASTMPMVPNKEFAALPPYPEKLSRQLNLMLFPLDITTPHEIFQNQFVDKVKPHVDRDSPLATWVNTFMSGIFRQIVSMVGPDVIAGLSLHDPLTIWYMLTGDSPQWKLAKGAPEDIRIETGGQWTHGMCVSDRRDRVRADGKIKEEIQGDEAGWLSSRRRNRINRFVASPGHDAFAHFLLQRIFG